MYKIYEFKRDWILVLETNDPVEFAGFLKTCKNNQNYRIEIDGAMLGSFYKF